MHLVMRLSRLRLAQNRAPTLLSLKPQQRLRLLLLLLPKRPHVPWLPCVVMTDPAKSAPKLRLWVVAVMASPAAASLVTAPAVTKAQVSAETVMGLPHAVHVWAMRRSVLSALRWSRRKTRCVAWPRKRTVKC
jgi:hypothetical protein